jgi:predicted dehydrogenase
MKLNIGIVGRRGLSTIQGFKALPDTDVVALCELNEDLLAEQASKHGIPRRYRIFEDMLASDIDVVVIATPMQLHVQQIVAAMEAGKHVLSEVPAGVTMDELWWLIETVEKYKTVYMMAENYCYMPMVQLVQSLVDRGLFGEVYFGEGEYLHDLYHLRQYADGRTSWRSYWQLGKRGAFYPTHSVGPVMKWFDGDHVESVICVGTGWNTHPDMRQEDTTLTLCQMHSGRLIKIRLDCLSRRPHNLTYYSLQGTKGSYEAPRGLGDEHKIWLMDKGPENPEWSPLMDLWDEYMPERYKNATEEQRNAGHWGGDFFIVKDFVDACIHGTTPYVDVYEACEWTAVGLLSELSVMNGGRAMEMPNFRRRVPFSEQRIKL